MRIVKVLLPVLLITSFFSSLGFAAQSDRISGSLSNGQSHVLEGNIRHQALPEYDQGRVDPAMQLGTITLLTAPTAAQESALQQLLAQQQDRKSANYHKWLTPEQYADRFGLSQNDMQQMVAWLSAQGFTMIQPARGRNWISFSGTAAQVESAFGTEIHHYNVKGELHYANATAPSIPAALAGIVSGIHGLDDFLLKPMGVKPLRPDYYSSTIGAQYIAPGDVYTIYDVNPLLTATPKIDGTGQRIAIMGQTEVYQSDINNFRTGFGITPISCTTQAAYPDDIITACSDPHFSYVPVNGGPGKVSAGDLGESDLDIEWSGAVAPGAQIIFVTSPASSGGTFNSFYYAIDNNLAPVISLSYGDCEFNENIGEANGLGARLFEQELQFANSEGITFVNSSGDTGAAACDNNGPPTTLSSTGLATLGLAVSYPASSPEVTAVGGTAVPLADFGSQYWNTPSTNPTNGGTAISYVPEQAWDDGDEFLQFCQGQTSGNGYEFCQNGLGNTALIPPWAPITSLATAQKDIGIGAGGGGASNCAVQNSNFSACVSGFTQPSWQTVNVSGQTTRMVPDVVFLATPNFPGYIFCTQLSELGDTGSGSSCNPGGATGITDALGLGNPSLVGGTSVSAPMFAGIVALLNQYTASAGQGNINKSLYQLAATAPSAFHDITTGTNHVACEAGTPSVQPTALQCPSGGVIGYSATAGFDMATGLGSVDVDKLAVALKNPPDFSVSSSTSSLSVYAGQSGTATITVTPVNNFSGPLSFSCSGPTGTSCSFNPSSVTPDGGPATTTATITAGDSSGSVVIYATTSLGTSGTASHVSNQTPAIALTVATPFTFTSTGATTFQVPQGQSANATFTLTLANGFTGTVSFTCTEPPTLTESTCKAPLPTNASGTVTFNVTTMAPTSARQRLSDRGARIFYAALLPGLLGLVLTAGTRRRSLGGMRFLGLILVMGFSTLWLASCSGSNSGQSNPGTPVGNYTITVNATSNGATVSPAPTFTVNVVQ